MHPARFLTVLIACACLPAQTPPKEEVKTPPPTVNTEVVNPAQPLPDVPGDTVILSVGDEKVTAEEFARLVETLPEQLRSAARGAGRRRFAENVVNIKLLAHEALQKKVDQDPVFQTQVRFQRESLLAETLYRTMAAEIKIDEAASRKYYEEHKQEWEQAKARHILIRMHGSPVPVKPDEKDLSETEALAKIQEIRAKLVAGADFAKLAETESDDPGTAAKGGDLGTFKHGQMYPSFEEAAFNLTQGQISEPVKTPFGYHLILLESKEQKSFAEVRPEIEGRLKPEYARKAIEDLRKNATVTFNESYFSK